MAGFELATEDEGGIGEFLFWQAERGAKEDFGRPATDLKLICKREEREAKDSAPNQVLGGIWPIWHLQWIWAN